MKKYSLPLLSTLFLGMSVLLLVINEVLASVLVGVLAIAGFGGWVIERAQQRGDPRAGGLHGGGRGPYLLIAIAIAGLGALVGLLLIVFASSFTETLYRGPDTPTEARIFGALIAAVCLFGVFAGIRRWIRSG